MLEGATGKPSLVSIDFSFSRGMKISEGLGREIIPYQYCQIRNPPIMVPNLKINKLMIRGMIRCVYLFF